MIVNKSGLLSLILGEGFGLATSLSLLAEASLSGIDALLDCEVVVRDLCFKGGEFRE